MIVNNDNHEYFEKARQLMAKWNDLNEGLSDSELKELNTCLEVCSDEVSNALEIRKRA